MASRRYLVYRYEYTPDNSNGNFIREQRVTLDNQTGSPLVPVTSLFLTRVVSLPEDQRKIKAQKFRENERNALVYYINGDNYRETKRYIPFADVMEIKNHLAEIEQLSETYCLDYVGESRNFNN